MTGIKFGCQFYTWQMSGARYVGELPHILDIVAAAGYRGIEPEICMLGSYYDEALRLRDALTSRGLELGAITLVLDWRGRIETDTERHEAERLFNYMKPFPDAQLVLCQMPGNNRRHLRERQENALRCINAVATRAADRGISSSFHPNSPPGSVFRSQEDYGLLMEGIDTRVLGFAPDSGHIAKGGIDAVDFFTECLPLIRHVHFKDISSDGEWAPLGDGAIDHRRIVSLLKEYGYSGWIMIEEESAAAELDPDTAARLNGEFLNRELLPLQE